MPSWEIHPRNPDLTRTRDPLSRWRSLTLIERFNAPDTWVIDGPADVMEPLTAPGMGVILDRDGVQVTTGQAGKPRRYWEGQREFIEIGFESDLSELGGRVVLPNPALLLTATPQPVGAAQDARTGTREDLILAYIAAHIGGTAQTSRRLTALTVPASLGRGGTTNVEARFDHLGVLVQSLAEAGRLRVTIEHDESLGPTQPQLALRVMAVPDVSANVRFGPADSVATGIIVNPRIDWERPTCTRAIVIAGGEKEARLALMLVNTEAEAMWGTPQRPFIREETIDQRQTADPVVMTEAAQKALDEGAGYVNIAFDVVDGPDVQVRNGYDLGYKVGTDLPNIPDALADNVVREMHTTVTATRDDATEKTRIVVGTPDASDQQTKSARQVAKALRRITTLERST